MDGGGFGKNRASINLDKRRGKVEGGDYKIKDPIPNQKRRRPCP